jgi:hypothetical protein
VHDGRLRIDGDAEAGVRFLDASGQPLEQSAVAPLTAMTPGGHAAEMDLSPNAVLLLGLMANRDGWQPDELCVEGHLAASEVSVTLLELELMGLVLNGMRGYQTSTGLPAVRPSS